MNRTNQIKNKRTLFNIALFTAIAKEIAEAKEKGLKLNKNKVYSTFGVSTGSPIFTPQRKKFKGYLRTT